MEVIRTDSTLPKTEIIKKQRRKVYGFRNEDIMSK